MRNLSTILFSILLPLINYAQEYKINMSNGLINIIEVDEVSVTGYDGSEVIISAPGRKEENDEKAKGLRVLSSSGLFDNTGIGLSVQESDGTLTIQQVGQNWDHEEYEMRIPRNLNIYLEHSDASGEDIVIENMAGEIEISCNYNDVYLDDIFGPMAIKTVYGEIEAEYTELSQKGSHSLYSIYGSVDVSIPQASSANVTMQSDYGSLYSNMQLSLEETSDSYHSDNCNTKHKKTCTTEFIEGMLNKGGVDLTLKSNYDNIYLRSN